MWKSPRRTYDFSSIAPGEQPAWDAETFGPEVQQGRFDIAIKLPQGLEIRSLATMLAFEHKAGKMESLHVSMAPSPTEEMYQTIKEMIRAWEFHNYGSV